MGKKSIAIVMVIALWGIGAVVCPQEALAFTLSVTPYEGGYDVNFGKVNSVTDRVDKEVRVNISEVGTQYRLVTAVLDPLRNAQGTSISPLNFTVYGLLGSNRMGTINVTNEMPVSQSRTVLYTSNQQGSSDSFILVYSIKGPLNAPSGSYRGKISFIVEPVSGTASPVTAVLNLYAEIEESSTVTISTSSGSNYITLNSQRVDQASADVAVSFQGSLGSSFTIVQSLTSPIMSSTGETLPEGTVEFKVTDIKKGSGLTQSTPLALRRQTLYTSDLQGSQDNFLITYSLASPESQKAGTYKSRVQYTLESATQRKTIDTLNLEVLVNRVFELVLTPQLGGSLEFRNLQPNETKSAELLVEVKSNIGKRYQVSQRMSSDLANKEGTRIASSNFTVREESIETKGTLRFLSPAESRAGDLTLFMSDAKGSSDKFKVIYELNAPADLRAGDYTTTITYSISEL